jgi:hypothetical protein
LQECVPKGKKLIECDANAVPSGRVAVVDPAEQRLILMLPYAIISAVILVVAQLVYVTR